MRCTENAELTVLCLIHNGKEYLLQDRVKEEWKGFTLPGGHVEKGESIKHFPIEGGRYMVFLFRADKFEGEVVSSEEGKMHWIHENELSSINLVDDFNELLTVMLDDNLNEIQYVIDNDKWKVVLK